MRSPSAFSGSAKARALNSTGISVYWVLESGGQMMGVTKAVILTSLFTACKCYDFVGLQSSFG